MKNFLVFYGSKYYPLGGMDDFIGDYDTIEESIDAIKKEHKEVSYKEDWEFQWCSIWDSSKRKEVNVDLLIKNPID
jgi:hypothetical protein